MTEDDVRRCRLYRPRWVGVVGSVEEEIEMNHRDMLRDLIKQRCFQFGDFTLASGRKSNYYCDARRLLTGECLIGCAMGFFQNAIGLQFNCVGGLETGAIPLTAAFVMHDIMGSYPKRPEGFYVRKQPKTHGTGNLIEGHTFYPGDRALILDDVLTTGGSALKAIEAVEYAGGVVEAVMCVVDRLQGAEQLLKGYRLVPLFTVKDFGITPEETTS